MSNPRKFYFKGGPTMAKIAMLIVILVTELVVTPARANSGYGSPLGPFAFIITNGTLVSCYDMRAHMSSTGIELKGESYRVNNLAGVQPAIGYAVLSGSQVVWGLEAFPNSAVQVAAKIGGAFPLSTGLGNGFGFHIIPTGMIPFSFNFRLGAGLCHDFVPL